ncbi:class I SAM-dependent methyltransferase [Saccharomonospora sp.]|uniref:class I SAM-dependent methyltransferase n=1 Tax=Saccharomonospora sp. TaxID=33913 RepID=UPI00260D1620|nr:class I SAM-dependent methyltransferase [Saccharomonospora sp.]
MRYHVKPEAYGEALHEVYDHMYPGEDTLGAIEFLASLAGPEGRVVEFGAGTGRLAIPLAERGLEVYAIEASPSMLDNLHERDAGNKVKTVCADFAEHVVGDGFDLCYIACNTLFMVVDSERQIEVLRRAAEHLKPGGRLVVEVYDPTPIHRFDKPNVQIRHLTPDRVMIDHMDVDQLEQLLVQVHTVIGNGSVSTYTELSRYAFPRELDLMARLAGLDKEARYGDWRGGPFGHGSRQHVTVYRSQAQA